MESFPIKLPLSACSTEMSWWQPSWFNSSSFSSIPVIEASKLSVSHSLWPQLKNNWDFGKQCLVDSYVSHYIQTLGDSSSASFALWLVKCLHLIPPICPLIQEKKSLWFQKGWPMRLWRKIKIVELLLGEFALYLDAKKNCYRNYPSVMKWRKIPLISTHGEVESGGLQVPDHMG